MKQRALTIITTIRDAAARKEIEDFLRERGDDLQSKTERREPTAFDCVRQLHFLSLFVIRERERQGEKKGEPPLLVLEANFDGSRQDFLARLVEHQRPLLNRIYASSPGYPGANESPESVCGYLERAHRHPEVFYVSSPGHTVAQIDQEVGLGARVEQILGVLGAPHGRRSEHIRRVWCALSGEEQERIRNVPPPAFWVRYSLREQPLKALLLFASLPLGVLGFLAFALVALQAMVLLPQYLAPPASLVAAIASVGKVIFWLVAAGLAAWLALLLFEFPAKLTLRMRLRVFLGKLWEMLRAAALALPAFIALWGAIALLVWQARALLYVVAAVLLAALLFAALFALRLALIALLELDDPVEEMKWKTKKLQRLLRRENHGAQNHFVSVTKIKPGWLRLNTLRGVLWWTDLLARIAYDHRGLAGIPSIHFARWQILPCQKRLLFVTNYDGGWGGYLGQFVTFAAPGITAIWGNTGGFPRPFYLFGDGSRDEQRFKSYARRSQVETLLWYRRFPELTVSAIKRNGAICEDLQRFSGTFAPGGAPIPEAQLDTFLGRFSAPRR